MSVVDLTTNKEITKVTVGLQPSGLAVSPDGTRLYALNKSGDKLTVINTANNQVLGSTKVGILRAMWCSVPMVSRSM